MYHRLVERAMAEAVGEASFVLRLASSWSEELDALGEAVAADVVTEDEWRVLGRLTSAINDPRLSADALVEWVDAFTVAVSRLFAADLVGAASAESVELPFSGARGAGNRRPALALAA
jgi:hypothetical protein